MTNRLCSWPRPVKTTVLVAALLIHGCALDPVEYAEPSSSTVRLVCLDSENEAGDGECVRDLAFRHPLQNAAIADGRVPLLDVKDSPSGKRYALQDSGSQDGVHTGVVELDVRPFVPDTVPVEPEVSLRGDRTADRIGSRLAQLASSAAEDEGLLVEVAIERAGFSSFTDRLWRRIAMGDVPLTTDVDAVVADVREEMAREIATEVDEMAARLAVIGAEVVHLCENAHCLTVNLPASAVDELKDLPGLLRADVATQLSEQYDVDFLAFTEVHQLELYWDQGYDGENGAGTDLRFAIPELGGFRTTHKSFNEGVSGTRVAGKFDCSTSSCSTVSGWTSPIAHATATASAVFGDLTDNQQSGLTNEEEIRRSGAAREARGYLYRLTSNSSSANRRAFDHLNSLSPKPYVVSSSIADQSDETCSGESTREIDVDNLLYEQGILFVQAAGNAGQSTTDCRVRSPGAAAGAFTVGGYAGASSYSNRCSLGTAPLASNSSSGGLTWTFSEGKKRSIIDVVAPYRLRLRADEASDTGYTTFSGTSISAPQVAGAALDFIDMYSSEVSSFAQYNPGFVAAWLTQFGDREQGSSHSSTLSHSWGAGRLRMRALNTAGLDSPHYFYSGTTCVDHGETYVIHLLGGATISSDIESLNAVVWWYDRRLEYSNTIDNINLYLRDATSGSVVVASVDQWDNKERVHLNNAGGRKLDLEISGVSVTSDNEGCGSNSMRVHYAVLFEDDDRDDSNGPSWNATTCLGVSPML